MNYYFLSVLLLSLSACDSATDPAHKTLSTLSGPDIQRHQDSEMLKRGFDLYQQHCQTCHGRQAEGAPDWRQRLPDNSYPPPPLNGSGHAWHHSLEKLRLLILNGGQTVDIEGPVTTMPPWRDRLSDMDVTAIIAWFQSLWPDPVYAIWYEQQVRARGR